MPELFQLDSWKPICPVSLLSDGLEDVGLRHTRNFVLLFSK
jgi:hypothetical protein